MADEVAEVAYRLVPEVDRAAATRAGDQMGDAVERGASDRTGGFNRVGAGFAHAIAAGAAGVIGAGFIANNLIGSASDLAETESKVQQIFGNAAGSLLAWSQTTAQTMGQSRQQALDAASTFAIFGTAAGLSGEDLVGFSTGLSGLASDLASFNNTTPEAAIEAIGAALRGESEPIRAYGVMLDDATLKAAAMELGIYNGTGALTQQQKVLAAQHAIMQQTTLAQGDFARTSDGLANKQRILAARFEDFRATLGERLLPVALQVVDLFTDRFIPGVQALWAAFQGDGVTSDGFIGFMERVGVVARQVFDWLRVNVPPVLAEIRRIAGEVFAWLGEHVPPVLERIREIAEAVFPRLVELVEFVVAEVEQRWPAVQEIIERVIEAVRVTVERVVDVITFIWERFGDNIVNFVTDAWGAVSRIIDGELATIKGVLDVFIGVFTGDWGRAWDGIKGIVFGAWDFIRGIIGAAWEIIKAVVGVGVEAVANLMSAAWDRIVAAVYSALSTVVEFFRALPGWIVAAVGDLGSLLVDAGQELVIGLARGILNIWDSVLAFFRDLPRRTIEAIGYLGNLLWEVGTQIIQGLWDGLKSRWESVKSWFGGLGDAVVGFLKGGFLINSPARIMIPLGEGVIEGVQVGMEKIWDETTVPWLRALGSEMTSKTALGLERYGPAASITPRVAVAAQAQPAGSPINLNLTIQAWPGTDAARVGREAAAAIRQGLRELEGAQA